MDLQNGGFSIQGALSKYLEKRFINPDKGRI
jgi:hypothetical protein